MKETCCLMPVIADASLGNTVGSLEVDTDYISSSLLEAGLTEDQLSRLPILFAGGNRGKKPLEIMRFKPNKFMEFVINDSLKHCTSEQVKEYNQLASLFVLARIANLKNLYNGNFEKAKSEKKEAIRGLFGNPCLSVLLCGSIALDHSLSTTELLSSMLLGATAALGATAIQQLERYKCGDYPAVKAINSRYLEIMEMPRKSIPKIVLIQPN